MTAEPFWKSKTLDQRTLANGVTCDGCGRCCLNKLEEEDTGEFLYQAACKLLDIGTCCCTDYSNRHDKVLRLCGADPRNVGSLGWLPGTCAYRLLAEGKSLLVAPAGLRPASDCG
jgi:hypothetical protein